MEPHHSLTENARITQLLSSYSLDPEPMNRPSRRRAVRRVSVATSDAVFPPPHVKCLKVIKASRHASVV